MIPASEVDFRLRAEMEPLARRLRSRHFHIRGAWGWSIIVVAMLATLGVCVGARAQLSTTLAALGAIAIAGSTVIAVLVRRTSGMYEAVADALEREHPDLAHTLTTALEQRPEAGDRYTFLQQRVIRQALDHARTHDWERVRLPHNRVPLFAHLAAIGCAVAIGMLALRLPRSTTGEIAFLATLTATVTPGDAEVQRGSLVVVAARFEGGLPREATLVWTPAGGGEQRMSMARSLSDPVFAATLPAVSADITYRVDYDGDSTSAFHLRVYELPALVQADAVLDFPAYTGREVKRVEDTRRISAVQGTEVDYEFLLNKPVRRAVLRDSEGVELELTPADRERTKVATHLTLDQSVRYTLHLEDDAGRANAWPDEIRLEALPNHPPELSLEFPRGDQRVSALEEIHIAAKASDDFGLLDYGLGFAVGPADPELVSLKSGDTVADQTAFTHTLDLEARGVQPDNLVSWFAWARDHGPDGAERFTSSDLFFGEVRPFDEIFHEQGDASPQGQPGQPGGGNRGEELIEIQRQISLALWKLKQIGARGETLTDDTRMLSTAQRGARRQLESLRSRLQDEREQTAAVEADRHMEKALETLELMAANSDESLLDPAWRSSQGALQALIRMQPRETRVAMTRNSGGQGGANRNQRQLNQLRFRSNDDAYETESRAQALTSPEEREQLQTLSRLRELARRQQDLNQRLQELQAALVAAQDESERERIERELKRLEEEQRRMLADLDEVRQRLDQRSRDPGSREAREQLDRTREDMRRSSESLSQGAVSEALASGTRAQENLDRVRDELRRESSSRFAEDMREARRSIRELNQQQESVERDLDDLESGGRRALDDSETRDELAQRMQAGREQLDSLLNDLRRVTEESDGTEPGLHQQLYDMLREQGQGATGERLEQAAEMLRRGFVEQTREMQSAAGRELEELQEGIERAAESVLGDEASTMRFAQRELEDLTRAFSPERDAGDREPTEGQSASTANAPPRSDRSTREGEGQSRSGGGQEGESQGGRPAGDELTRALDAIASGGREGGRGGVEWTGPLTGGDYGDWSERLRTVESLLELPGARERIAASREQAERLRAEFRRHGTPPQWSVVESGIVAPLNEVRVWLQQELARQADPTVLQPVDRDPVPEAYADAVKRYYEELGK